MTTIRVSLRDDIQPGFYQISTSDSKFSEFTSNVSYAVQKITAFYFNSQSFIPAVVTI